MPCAQKRLQSSTEGVVYPLQPDQREFFCIVKKVNDARNHESAAAHLLRDAGYVAQVGSTQPAGGTQRAAAQEAAHRASRARWVADESEDDDSEDDVPTPEEEEEARAAVERGELRARSELWPPREQPPDVIEDVD